MHCLVLFITAVCLIFLLKLKWPKNKSHCYWLLGMSVSVTQWTDIANVTVRDHLRSNLGIMCGLGSFAVLYSPLEYKYLVIFVLALGVICTL